MTAVDVFQAAIGEEFDDDHGRVLADVSLAQKLIYGGSYFRQSLPRRQLGMDDPLQRRRYDCRSNALTGHIDERYTDAVFQHDCVVKIAADGETGYGFRVERRVGKHRQHHRHESTVNSGGNGKLFPRLAGFLLGLGEQRILQEPCCLGGDGIEDEVIDFGEIAGFNAAIEIQEPEQLAMLVRRQTLAQRDAVNSADVVHHDAGPAHHPLVGRCVTDRELLPAVDCIHNCLLRDSLILRQDVASGVEAFCEMQLAL